VLPHGVGPVKRASLLLLLAPLFAGGCVRSGPAVEIPRFFSAKYVCPEDRITSRERPDLPYRRFVCPGAKGCEEDPPPAELAGDPERVALFRQITRDARDRGDPGSDPDHRATFAVEVSGCGQHRFYACRRGYSRRRSYYYTDCGSSSILDLGDKEP
jgi:hypothetical protein